MNKCFSVEMRGRRVCGEFRVPCEICMSVQATDTEDAIREALWQEFCWRAVEESEDNDPHSEVISRFSQAGTEDNQPFEVEWIDVTEIADAMVMAQHAGHPALPLLFGDN